MKKNWYLFGILSLAVIVLFSFASCERFKIDNLTANRYFKQANGMYENEQYEEAAENYKEGLTLNPNASQYYIYLGTACSMAYQPSILPPEMNSRYQNVEQTNQQLMQEIEEAEVFVSNFEGREEFKSLIDQRAELASRIEEARDELQMVTVSFEDINRQIDYNRYTDYKTQLESAQRRLQDNEAFFAQLEQKEEEATEEEGERTLADIQAEWELKRDIENRRKQLSKDRDLIEEARFFVERFEQDPGFIEKKNNLAALQADLTDLESQLNAIPEYKMYQQKKEEIEYKTKEIEYNKNYKNEVVNNEEIRNTAIEYLHKALEMAEEDAKREKIYTALSDLYSKMIVLDDENEEYFKKAEEYRMKLLEKDPDNLDNYYVMAEFYKSHRKIDKVIETYQARIKLDPKNPEVYSRFSQFLGEARRWDPCIEMAKRRIYALLNPDEIIPLTLKMDENNAMREEAEKAQQYIDNIRKQRVLSSADKRRLIDEQLEKMKAEGQLTLEQIEKQNAGLQEQIDRLFAQALESMDQITDEELRKELLLSFYTLGVRHWNYSYYTDDLNLPRDKRKDVIEDGIKYLDFALQLDPEYAEAVIYTSLLWREKTKVDPTKYETYREKADELRDVYTRLKEKQAKKAAAEIQTEQTE